MKAIKTLQINSSKNIKKNLYSTSKKYFAKAPMTVTLTGSSGNIGYALAFRIASGEMLGKDQPVILNLIDLPQMEEKLLGVKMELQDCSFPLLEKINTTSDMRQGFKDADVALLVGSVPRGKGMERADLLKINGKIFVDTGKVIKYSYLGNR